MTRFKELSIKIQADLCLTELYNHIDLEAAKGNTSCHFTINSSNPLLERVMDQLSKNKNISVSVEHLVEASWFLYITWELENESIQTE